MEKIIETYLKIGLECNEQKSYGIYSCVSIAGPLINGLALTQVTVETTVNPFENFHLKRIYSSKGVIQCYKLVLNS